MKLMSLRLEEEDYEQLETVAEGMGIPPAVMARALLKGALEMGADRVLSKRLGATSQAAASSRPAKNQTGKKRRKGGR